MRQLRSVHQVEETSSVPGLYALSDGYLQAPDRWAQASYVVRPPATRQLQEQLVAIGGRQWVRQPGGAWQAQPQDGALPFRTAALFTWSSYAEAVRLIGVEHNRGHGTATLALMDPGTPAWWTLRVDLATDRVLDARLITSGHFISVRYSEFNSAPAILAPTSAPRATAGGRAASEGRGR
jgi:hypothetical protein